MNKALWIQAACQAGIQDFEIYEHKSASVSMQMYEQKVDGFTISECDGIALRGIYHGKMGICFLENTQDEMLSYALQQIMANAESISSEDEVEIYAGEDQYPTLQPHENTFCKLPVEEKIAILKQIETAILESDTRISQVMSCDYAETEVSRSIVNSKGLQLSDTNPYSMIVAQVLAKDQEDTKSDYDWIVVRDRTDLDIASFAQGLSAKVCAKLHAEQIVSGNYPVLMMHDTMCSLVEALKDMFNGEIAFKGISIIKNRLHEQIFDEKITMIDDPLLPDGYNSAAFDDEGVSCKTKTVVEKGVLMTYLHNLKSAKLMKTTSTGNGFKGSYAGGVGINSTNFYIQDGDSSYDDMVQTIEKGLIITDITGLHAGLNTISTEFSLQASGFYVESGKIIKAVNLITIAGNFMDMMKAVDLVGNDGKMKYSGVGSPSILFHSLAVSGE